LLGELLLERHYFTIMTRYVSQPENLKTMMNMLRESSRNIQFEAFHVFKVISSVLFLSQENSLFLSLQTLTVYVSLGYHKGIHLACEKFSSCNPEKF